jgi:hypothetical protein
MKKIRKPTEEDNFTEEQRKQQEIINEVIQ